MIWKGLIRHKTKRPQTNQPKFYRYVGPSISFQTFLYKHLRLSETLENSVCYCYTWQTNFYDFRFKWTATTAIGIHSTPAWLSELVNFKMQPAREDTLDERYAIKFCFKLGKNATETYGMLQAAFRLSCMNQFLSDIRDSRKAGSLWGMMRDVAGVRKSEHKSWLSKGLGLGLGLLCWGFARVQQEIPWEEPSTLQIGSVAFPPGQYTSLQLHPGHWLFDKDGHQDSSSPSL